MTQEEKDQELEKQLTNFGSAPTWWHDRYIVFFLLQHGAQFTKKDGKESLLCGAVLNGDYMFVKFLLLCGADPNKQCNIIPCVAIFEARNEQIAKLLVANGADVHKQIDRNSVLHQSIWLVDDINLIRYFIAQKVAIDSSDDYGNTVLHGTAIHYEEEDDILQKAELFLYNGVPLDTKNKGGNTAEDILNRKLREEYECTKKYAKVKNNCFTHRGKANLHRLLAMIQEQRERRAELPKQWRTFLCGWFTAGQTNPWPAKEIVHMIKEYVIAPPYNINNITATST